MSLTDGAKSRRAAGEQPRPAGRPRDVRFPLHDRRRAFAPLAALALGAVACAASEPAAGTLVLYGATLLDGRGGPPAPSTTIVVSGGRIREVKPFQESPSADRASRFLDVRGRYVIPGLVNAGAALSVGGACSPGAGRGAAQTARNLRATLRDGVTSAADLGSGLSRAVALRDWVAAAPGRGPRVFPLHLVAAFPEGSPAGYLDDGAPPDGAVTTIAGPADARLAAERALRRGGEGVLALVAGSALDSSPEAATSPALLRALARETRIRGLRFLARANFESGWRAAVDADAAMLVQSPVDPIGEDLLRALRVRGVLVAPALSPLDAVLAGAEGGIFITRALRERLSPALIADLRRFRRRYRHADHVGLGPAIFSKASLEAARTTAMANLARLRAAGVRVAVASDAGACYCFHGAPLREMALLEEAGFTPREILRAATLEAASAIGFEGQIGTVEVGKLADLVVLREDPSATLGAYRTVEYVIAGGALVEGDGAEPSWPDRLSLGLRLWAASMRPDWT